MNSKEVRHGGLDLLRSISMFLIIVIHALSHEGVLENAEKGTIRYWFIYILYAFTWTGNNCYVLLSGYFLYDKKSDMWIRMKKMGALILKTAFYSIGIYAVLHFMGLCETPRYGNLSMVMPIIHNQYWFITKYIGLYAIYPFLNIGIRAMNQNEHLHCIGILGILYSVIPTVFCVPGWLGDAKGGYSVTWFVILYLIAAYVKRYRPNKKNIGKTAGIYMAAILLVPCSKFLIPYISQIQLFYFLDPDVFYASTSPLVLVASVAIFLCFKNIDIKGDMKNKIIRKIASCTTGIYLIHNHQDLKRIIWSYAGLGEYRGDFLVMRIVVVCIIIFAICTLIEMCIQLIWKGMQQLKIHQ